MDKPSLWVKFFNTILNHMFGFVHIWPKILLHQPSIF